jgi:hypothetical protein
MRDALIWVRAQWDRIAGTACILVGAVVLVLTFQGVANTRFVVDQIALVTSGGLGALFLVAVGVMLRFQSDFHDEWRKLDRIEAALRGDERPDSAILYAAARGGATPPPPPRSAPLRWRSSRVTGAAVIPLLGLLSAVALLAAGYQRAANAADVDRAVAGLTVGVAGLGLAALVVTATALVTRARLAHSKHRLLAGWLGPVPTGSATDCRDVGTVCVAPKLTRFHRPGCPTLAYADFSVVARTQVPIGLRPCQVCGAR